jgi:hypothetical protein
MQSVPKVRLIAQNWSKDRSSDAAAVKAAQELMSQLPEGRIVSADPGSLLVEAVAPGAADATRFLHRLESVLPGWSVYPQTRYKLIG